MQIHKLFGAFRRRLLWECCLRGALVGAALGAAGIFITSLVYHIKIVPMPPVVGAAIGGGLFLLGFLGALLWGFPTDKRVAKRVDALGLQERASTMLAFQKQDTPMVRLQREDAAAHIRETSPKQLKLQVGKKRLLISLVSICLAATMVALPFDVFAKPQDEDALRRAQAVKELIAQLREEVKQAQLPEGVKAELNEIIDQLETDLENAGTELEQAAQIQQAMDEMEQVVKNSVTKYKIGEALQKYEITRPLGEAISEGNIEKVSIAIADLETQILEDPTVMRVLREAVAGALEASGVDPADALYSALAGLAQGLMLLEDSVGQEDFPSRLGIVLVTAEEGIKAALLAQAEIEAEAEMMQNQMEQTKAEILGQESQEDPEATGEGEPGEGDETRPSDGEGAEGEPSEERPEETGPGGPGNQGTAGGDSPGNPMTEGIYDPISGSVTYGEVFAAYYAQYLEALEAGEVSPELQEIIDRYFGELD